MSISYSGYCDICKKQTHAYELRTMLGVVEVEGERKTVRLHVCPSCVEGLEVRNGIVDMTSTLRTATPKD